MDKRIVAWMLVIVFSQVSSAWADDPMGANESNPVETMTMSPTQAAQAGETQQAVMEGLGAVAAAMQPSVNAVAFADPAAPMALEEVAKNPKPGVYDEAKMKEMIEQAKKNGQIIYVQISATWCGPCAAAIKKMQEMADKYKDGVIYIVVEMGVTPEQMAAYAKKYKDTIFIGISGQNPPQGFPAPAYPTFYYFDGTKWVPGPPGVPDAATLKKIEEAMKKAQEEMKKKAEAAAAAAAASGPMP